MKHQPQSEIKQKPIADSLPDLFITISAVGDLMVHQTQLNAQRVNDHAYDFTNNFKFVTPYFTQSSLTLVNLESTLAGPEKGFSGYPRFNTPDALAEAMFHAGFDVVSTSNNHLYDMGGSGMLRTLDVLRKNHLTPVGTRKSPDENNFTVKSVNGIKIGITAYTYESPPVNGKKTINGLIVNDTLAPLINSFDYHALDQGIAHMQKTIQQLREHHAELIVFMIHWGSEYRQKPNHYQRTIADSLHRFGVDLIFGSHPHVIQPVEFLYSADIEQTTMIAYSLGNFISNQRYETLQNYLTEDGIMLHVEIKKNQNQDKVYIHEVSYTPTWVYRYYPAGKPVYEILPAKKVLENPSQFNIIEKWVLSRIENSYKRTTSFIDENLILPEEVTTTFIQHTIAQKESFE